MKTNQNTVRGVLIRAALVALCVFPAAAPGVAAHEPAQGSQKPQPSPRPQTPGRLRIEVTGGEKNQPVDNASVYVRFVEERKLKKEKKIEMNVKTNPDGIAHVPDPPTGRVLIQVIAEGWKTFGRWYDITDFSQPIQIHLEKPKQWY